MDSQYAKYAESRMDGNFGEMTSWRFVYPYLSNKRVLDIGCSDGLYLKQLSGDSRGIEQVTALAEAGREIGLDITTGDVLQSVRHIDDNCFEGVLFSHVMEHIDCPIVMLKEIYRVLQPQGTLVLGLPTERNIFRDLLRMDYFDGTHIYAFSLRNTYKLLQVTGFKVERVYFHLPKCHRPFGRGIESVWNLIKWPFREYISMAYWVVATKL
jgi:SAM-dependent methyltransferase